MIEKLTILYDESAELKKFIIQLEENLREKNRENEQLKETIEEERERSRIVMSNSFDYHNPYQVSNEELRSEMLQKEQRIAELSKEVEVLSLNIFIPGELRDRISDLETINSKSREENLRLEKSVQSLESELSKMILDKELLTHELQSTIHVLNLSKNSEEILTSQLNASYYEKKELSQKVENLESEKETMIRNYRALSDENERVSRQKEVETKKQLHEMILHHTETTKQYHLTTNDLSSKLDLANTKITQITQQKRDAEIAREEMKRELDNLLKNKDSLIEKATKQHQEQFEKEYSKQLAHVNAMQQEMEEKLKEVNEQVNNKKADEYNQRIHLLEQEQIIMSQAFYKMSLKLHQLEAQSSVPRNKENETLDMVNRIKNKSTTTEEMHRKNTVQKPSLRDKALANRTLTGTK